MVTPGLADAWGTLAAQHPDQDAVVAGADRRTFADLVRSAHGFGGWLIAEGLTTGDRVALVLPDRPELFEALAGALGVGIIPVTVDDRASADEVHRIVDATDVKAVVHGPAATRTVTRALKRIQRQWRPARLELGASSDTAVAAAGSSRQPHVEAPGTVVLVGPAPGSSATVTRLDTDALVDAAGAAGHGGDGSHLVLAPLAHGAGLVGSLTTISAGGTVVLPPAAGWHDNDLADTVAARERVARVTVDSSTQARAVHDAFPGLTVLRATTRTDDAASPAPRAVIETADGPVEPGRIEARVTTHRGVTACRVVGLATRGGSPAIVALVVVSDDHYLDAAEMRAWSRHKLTAPETPRVWLFVDELDPDATDAELRATALALLRPS